MRISNEQQALDLVNITGYDLQYVPQNFRTAAVCLAAVEQDPAAIVWVPRSQLTQEICQLVYDADPKQEKNIPEPFKSALV